MEYCTSQTRPTPNPNPRRRRLLPTQSISHETVPVPARYREAWEAGSKSDYIFGLSMYLR